MIEASDFGAQLGLEGLTVDVSGTRAVLEQIIDSGRRPASAYMSTVNDQQVVIRFLRSSAGSDPRSLLLDDNDVDGVLGYTQAGPAKFEGQSEAYPIPPVTFDNLFATIRPYFKVSLKDVLASNEQEHDAPAQSFRFAYEIARGIFSLHERGIFHGDIRPSNISLGRGIDIGSAAVADYGLEQYVVHHKNRFTPPEYLLDGALRTAESDVYSYGKVVREMLERIAPARRIERKILEEIVEQCLSLDPNDRPDIEYVVQALSDLDRPIWSKASMEPLANAVVSDIDARVESGSGVDAFDNRVRSAVLDSIESVDTDIRRRRPFRVALFSQWEMIHFLSSVSFVKFNTVILPRPSTPVYSILGAMNSSSEYFPARSQHARLLEVFEVDSQWMDEEDRETDKDLSGQQLSLADQKEYKTRQMQALRDLTQTVIKSDTFIRSDDVASIMSGSCPGINAEEVRTLRDMKYLLSLPFGDYDMYPLFQFNRETGLPRACIKTVLDCVANEKSTWSQNVWWFLQTHVLDHETPADWLREGKSEAPVADYLRSVFTV